jgi:hypothetical protein
MRQGVAIALPLPDGRYLFQRRDDKAPTAKNQLACLGGDIEPCDQGSPRMAAWREMCEESSILSDPQSLQFLGRVSIAWSGPLLVVHVYRLPLQSPDIEIYEGLGAELYTLEKLQERTDVSFVTQHLLPLLIENPLHLAA